MDRRKDRQTDWQTDPVQWTMWLRARQRGCILSTHREIKLLLGCSERIRYVIYSDLHVNWWTDPYHGLWLLTAFHVCCRQVNQSTLGHVFVAVVQKYIRTTYHLRSSTHTHTHIHCINHPTGDQSSVKWTVLRRMIGTSRSRSHLPCSWRRGALPGARAARGRGGATLTYLCQWHAVELSIYTTNKAQHKTHTHTHTYSVHVQWQTILLHALLCRRQRQTASSLIRDRLVSWRCNTA